jgi:hypothetical protein
MASKHPYTSEADKGNFLGYIDDGEDIVPVAKKAKINIKTARRIAYRDKDNYIYNDQHYLPQPSLHDRCAIVPKPGRRQALTELNVEQLDNAISQDRKHREMPQLEVAEELGLHVSKTTVRHTAREVGFYRVKPTKKLALNDIQEAIRYEIALGREHWTLEQWRRVSFSDEAAILVGEHRGRYHISRKVDERYDRDCIEVRYNNYSQAMFWGVFSYDFKGPCYVYLKETAA